MSKYQARDYLSALRSYTDNRISQRLFSITLELTRRCNARCDYCNHWKEQRSTELEVADFALVIEHFQPFHVVICGGEPFQRRDVLEICRTIKSAPGPWRYVMMITNGWFLSDDKIAGLQEARVDQINVSLNWPDARQDQDRKLPGLFQRIERAVARMSARGMKVVLSCILMNDNLDELVPIAHLAQRWGVTVMYTLYSELQADNRAHLFPQDRRARLQEVLQELLRLKRRHGSVSNSEWYFEHIPRYVEGETLTGCRAGTDTVHISPEGMVRACCYLPKVGHFSEYDPRAAPQQTCTDCFSACRGELQAPVTLRRFIEAVRTA